MRFLTSFSAVMFAALSLPASAITDEALSARADRAAATKPKVAAKSQTLPGTPYLLETGAKELHFRAVRYTNKNNTPEVAYIFEEIRAFLPVTDIVVLYGRDTDGDGQMDAWFAPVQPGQVESYDMVSSDSKDGWDVAQVILSQKLHIEARPFLWMLTQAASQAITITGSTAKSEFEQINARQMDLLQLEIMADRSWKLEPNNAYARLSYAIVSQGWAKLSAELDKQTKEAIVLTLTDMTIAGLGQKVAQGLGWTAQWIGPKIIPAQAAAWAGRMAESFSLTLTKYAAHMLEKMNAKPAMVAMAKIGAAQQAAKLATTVLFQKVETQLIAMQSRTLIERAAATALLKVGNVAGHGLKELPYISVAVGSLAVGGIGFHASEFSDANPAIFMKNVVTNKDFMQSMLFQTDEAFLQAAITASSTNVPRRMMVTGFVSTFDSITVGTLLKGVPDPRRATFDTAWQATVANVQTNVDLIALKKMEEAAIRSSNPKLKLVGWAIVIANQAGGMFLYEWAVDKVVKDHSKDPKKTVKLIPVFANN